MFFQYVVFALCSTLIRCAPSHLRQPLPSSGDDLHKLSPTLSSHRHSAASLVAETWGPWIPVTGEAGFGHEDVARLANRTKDEHHPSPHRAPPERKKALREAWPGILMALIAGLATAVGALVVYFVGPEGPSPAFMAFILSMAAGVMITVSVELLLPRPNQEQLSWWRSVAIFSTSALCCVAFCKILDHIITPDKCTLPASSHRAKALDQADDTDGAASQMTTVISETQVKDPEAEQYENWRLSLLLFLSLTAHNFPEGFAVAVSALSSRHLGVLICIAIALHNIPEGMALAVSAHRSGKTKQEAVLLALCSGLTEPLGAICGILILQSIITPLLLLALLTAVAGIMCCIAVFELLPEAVHTGGWSWTFLGFSAGMFLMFLTHVALEYATEQGHMDTSLF